MNEHEISIQVNNNSRIQIVQPDPVGRRRKMNVFCTFKTGPFVPRKKGRFLDVF